MMESVFIESNLHGILENKLKIEADIIELEKDIITAESEHGIILILNDFDCIGPMSLAIEDIEDFKEFGIREKDKIILEKDSLKIDKRLKLEIAEYNVVDLRHQFNEDDIDYDRIKDNLIYVEEILYEHGKRGGMLPVVFNIGDFIRDLESRTGLKMYNNMYTSFMLPKIISLFEKLIQGRFDKAEICIKDLIDVGTENNNYSNGFLLGMMSSFVYGGRGYELDSESIVKLNEHLMKCVSIDKANLYHNMLIESSDGGSPTIILRAIESIIYEENKKDMMGSLAGLLRINIASGTDVLCGIYFGFRLLEKDKFRDSINGSI